MRRFFGILLALALLWTSAPSVWAAVPDLPDGIYLYEQSSSTCTLTSSTMMLRSLMYLNGSDNWPAVTQASVKSAGWAYGSGMKWKWTYTLDEDTIHVNHEKVSGISAATLKTLLDDHPEGIVLHCGYLPHAVFLTGYEGDTFYCAETVEYYGQGMIKLSESYLGYRYGSQSAILNRVTAYWYVEDYTINGSTCTCTEELSGIYVCTTTSTPLNIRGGHGTSYPIVGTIPPGAEVKVLEAGENWAHVEYNGVLGYASTAYLKKIGEIPVHTHEYLPEVTEPTCTEGGWTTYSCACGDSYKADETQALGHSFQGTVTEATCSERGYTTYTCVCGLSYVDEYVEISCPSGKFDDVSTSDWYHAYADFVASNGYMNGLGEGQFAPGNEIDRASVVVVLWNMAGKPAHTVKDNPFTDVAESAWYTPAILWAFENGSVSGKGAGIFDPGDRVTREQLTLMFYRFAAAMSYDLAADEQVDLTAYPDHAEVSGWANEAFQWACDLKLISGRGMNGGTYLTPGGTATRAEIAVIVTLFCGLL